MRVLIITHGRTGSTNLMRALGETLEAKMVFEPFNLSYWDEINEKPPYKVGEPIPEHCVFKCIVWHNHKWLTNNYGKFDIIIFLLRDSFRDYVSSTSNAMKYGFHVQYEDTQEPKAEVFRNCGAAVHTVTNWHVNFKGNKHLLWYEDIYGDDYELSKSVIQSLDLGITDEQFDKMRNTWFHPDKRLKKC